MDAIDALLRSMPASDDAVRRLFWRDPDFRIVCADYHDACAALTRLEAARPIDAARVAEYRELAAELLAEASARLKGDRS